MSWRVKFVMNLVVVCFLANDASSEAPPLSWPILWETNERSGLGSTEVLRRI